CLSQPPRLLPAIGLPPVSRRRRSACRSDARKGCGFSAPFSFAPFFLRFALHGWCTRVLHFEPIGRSAGAVERVLPFRDDALNPELAGVPKNSLAVALHVLVKSDARVSLGQHHLQCSLAALKRIGAQVVTIQLDQVEGV